MTHRSSPLRIFSRTIMSESSPTWPCTQGNKKCHAHDAVASQGRLRAPAAGELHAPEATELARPNAVDLGFECSQRLVFSLCPASRSRPRHAPRSVPERRRSPAWELRAPEEQRRLPGDSPDSPTACADQDRTGPLLVRAPRTETQARRVPHRAAPSSGSSEPLDGSLLRPARIAVTRSHLGEILDHREVDLRIRRAGLDVDPGVVPLFGRMVRVHVHSLVGEEDEA